MSETVRAFIALRIPPAPALRDVLAELSTLGRPVKTVAAEKLHVTLKFLGNTDASWLRDIEPQLHEIAANHSAFDVVLRGLGAFPKPSRPSVIWAGMTPPEPIVQLAAAVEESLVDFGFAAETRPVRPHVTLARIKGRPPSSLGESLERHLQTEFAAFTVNEIVLMKSELSPHGPRYTPLSIARITEPRP